MQTYAGSELERAANCDEGAEEDHGDGPVLVISFAICMGRKFLVRHHLVREEKRLLQILLAIFDIVVLFDGHFLILYNLINLRMKKDKEEEEEEEEKGTKRESWSWMAVWKWLDEDDYIYGGTQLSDRMQQEGS